MDGLKKSQESVGAAASGVTRQISETAADAKETLTDAAGQLSEMAQTATTRLRRQRTTFVKQN
jgi:hypothetical protein